MKKFKNIPHSTIICGDDTLKKEQMIVYFAKTIMCTQQNSPCEICSNCVKINKGVHPDLFILDNPSVSVDDIRKLKKDSFIVANDSEKKVYIVKNGHNLNLNCQNALLKTLEEPSSFSNFIIECDNEKKMLKTILSRCVLFKFNLEFANFRQENYEISIKIAESICENSEIGFVKNINKNMQKEDFIQVILIIKTLIRDAFMIEYSLDNIRAFDWDISNKLFLKKSRRELMHIYDVCEMVFEKCEFNTSVQNLMYYFVTNLEME